MRETNVIRICDNNEHEIMIGSFNVDAQANELTCANCEWFGYGTPIHKLTNLHK